METCILLLNTFISAIICKRNDPINIYNISHKLIDKRAFVLCNDVLSIIGHSKLITTHTVQYSYCVVLLTHGSLLHNLALRFDEAAKIFNS